MKRLEISIQSPTKTLQFPEVRLNRGLATYIDKEKVSGWLMPTPYMGSGASLDPKHLSTANIIQNFQNPKIEASPKEKEIYRNENAAEQISGSDNSHLYARLLSTANVIQNLPNPKVSTKNSLITPEMDASYLDAVERGADGLWRYEIPDVQIKRPDEWMGMRNIRLKDVVSGAEELFEAYPELADIKIKKGRGKGGGSYTHENKTIELGVAHLKGWIDALRNPSAYYSSYEEIEAGLLRQAAHLRSTLIHEIQHAIQRIEGFAQGGNSTMILDASARAKYDEMIESYNERVDKYNKMSVAEQRTTEGRDLANRLGSQRKAIDMFWKLNSIGASGYKRLAGEVEARNVEKRTGMPMAERLATLVEETEDVAREDQIIILEGINGVAEMAKK